MTDRHALDAILLAAGPSSRLGRPKQLVEYKGETLVRRTARMLTDLLGDRVVAVAGCEAGKVAAELQGLPLTTVVNPAWEKGMGGSIGYGARHVPEFTDGIMVMACDQWRLQRADLGKLVGSWRGATDRIHVASWKEGAAFVSGPPVIFPGRLRGELKGLDKGRGARQIIDRYMDIVEFVELESAGCDLDRPEDLEQLRNS